MSAVISQVIGVGSSLIGNLLTVIPKGSIGGIDIQATLEETFDDTVNITDHPVEAGAEISDHAYYKPSNLTMRCGWSNSSAQNLVGAVTNLFTGGGLSQFAGLSGLSNLTGLPGLGGSSSPTVSGGGMTVSDYVSGIYSQLLSLQQSLQPFTVLTSIRQFTNMMMTSLSLTRDHKTSQALMVTVTMRQVIIVNTQATTLPPTQNMANPQNTALQIVTGQQSLLPGIIPSPGGSGLGPLLNP
jgi:hypothetical protein